MTQQKRVTRIPAGVVAGITAAVVVAGGGAAWWTLNSPPPIKPSLPNTTQPSPSQQAAKTYWLKSAGKQFELIPVPNPQTASNQSNSPLEAAFNRLLAGPPDTALSSTIPQGTKLRGVKVEPDGVHVDLSEEFTTGGGSTSMTGRVAQVLYTATSLEPTAKVWISVEGKPLENLGGEGLELDQPLTRRSFEHNFTL